MNLLSRIRSYAYRKYTELETNEHALKYLFLEVTRRCNLNCRHCGSDCSSDSSMNELPTEQWLSLIDEMQTRYHPFFVITGGEPLVRNEFDTITAYLKERNARWGMVTNGIALTQEKLNGLIEHGLSSITLSLDGNEESHLYLRRHPRSWEQACNAMRLIGNSSIPLKDVVTCVTPSNLNTLDDTAKLLIENGITKWRLFRIFPKGAAAEHPELLLSFEESSRMVQWIADNRKKYALLGLDLSFSCEGYLPFGTDRAVRDEPFFCRAGINIASILADGSITGCNNNGEDFYQGNIATDNFDTVWNERFEEYRNHSWKKSGACSDCSEWKQCKGGSIHLREKSHAGPHFCYIKEVSCSG